MRRAGRDPSGARSDRRGRAPFAVARHDRAVRCRHTGGDPRRADRLPERGRPRGLHRAGGADAASRRGRAFADGAHPCRDGRRPRLARRLARGQGLSATGVEPRSMVVVATQGHGDEEAVEQAVAAAPAYVGLVASRRRGEALLGYLAQRGVPSESLARVRVPAGLDLGRTSHREVAVAILAELVQRRAAGAMAGRGAAAVSAAHRQPPCSRGDRSGLRHEDGSRTDANHPFEHERVTYYFCCARMSPEVRRGAGCLRDGRRRNADQERLRGSPAGRDESGVTSTTSRPWRHACRARS